MKTFVIAILAATLLVATFIADVGYNTHSRNVTEPTASQHTYIEPTAAPEPRPVMAVKQPLDLGETVAIIGELEEQLERSGLLAKARSATLSAAEEVELNEKIEAILELRDLEIQHRVARLEERLRKAK